MFAAIEKAITRFTRLVAIIGGAGLLFAVFITCLSIIGKLCRRLISLLTDTDSDVLPAWIGPILGEEELVQYAVGFALFTALPWLTLRCGHITVDLLKPFFGRISNLLLDFLGQLFLAGIIYLVMTQQWFLIFYKTRRGQDSLPQLLFDGNWTAIGERLQSGSESQILGLKLLPIYTVAELCVILWFIVSVFCLLASARSLRLAGKEKHV